MESRKMVLKNLFTGQQWRNRHREQTYGHGAKETLEIRIKSLERQEKSLREKYDSLQETINKAMGQAPAQQA